jgi:hypothetical protein
MTTENDPLKQYKRRQASLIGLVGRYRKVAEALESETLAAAATALTDTLESTTFRVLFLGEFKRGKSTLINAMLGDGLLPVDVAPCTAVVSEVSYADEPRVLLHPRDGQPAFEIPPGKLAEMITIGEEAEATENPYRLVEIGWPFDLCRDGVVIVDSPGLNEDSIREQVTGGYLDKADAIVFMSSATAPFSQSEQHYLRNFVLPLGHEDIFFVYSRIDGIDAGERARLEKIAIQRVSGLRSDGGNAPGRAPRVFFVNGKGALAGRRDGDQAAVAESGVPGFEHELGQFLTTEKGRVKLMRPAAELRGRLATARTALHDRELLNEQELATLTAKYEAERPRLRLLEQQRRVIVGGLQNEIRTVEAVVEDAARLFLGTLPPKCPEWAAEAELQSRVGSLLKTQEQAGEVVSELTGLLGDRLQDELLAWQSATLRPLLRERLSAIQGTLSLELADFAGQVRDVRTAITGGTAADAGVASDDALDELLSGGPGALLADSAIEVSGKPGGNVVLGAVLPQIGVLIAGLLLTFTTAGLAAAMVGTGILQAIRRIANINQALKVQVGEAVANHLKLSAPDQARAMGRQVGDELRTFAGQVDRGLRAQTDTVREQVDATIRDAKAGQDQVAVRRAELRELAGEIASIERERDELTDEIAGA